MDIFGQAAQKKLRFTTPQGNLSVENLFELPLKEDGRRRDETISLRELEILTSKELTTVSSSESYVDAKLKTATTESTKAKLVQLRLDIIRAVIDVKAEELEAKDTAETKAALKKELMEDLRDAKRTERKSKTPAEIEAMIAAL